MVCAQRLLPILLQECRGGQATRFVDVAILHRVHLYARSEELSKILLQIGAQEYETGAAGQ